jgi:hypothetical protein
VILMAFEVLRLLLSLGLLARHSKLDRLGFEEVSCDIG